MTSGGKATTCSDDVAVSVLMPPIHGRFVRGAALMDSKEDAGHDRREKQRANTMLN